MQSLHCGGQSQRAMGHDLHRGRVMAGLISSSQEWSIAPPGILVGSIGHLKGPCSQ